MKNPIEYFFSLGNNLNIKRKADYDFYLLIIMFCAFLTIFLDNLYRFFFVTYAFTNLGWSFVMIAILYFQYFGMKSAYEMRKMIKSSPIDEKVESKEDMLNAFKKIEEENKDIFDKELKGEEKQDEQKN